MNLYKDSYNKDAPTYEEDNKSGHDEDESDDPNTNPDDGGPQFKGCIKFVSTKLLKKYTSDTALVPPVAPKPVSSTYFVASETNSQELSFSQAASSNPKVE